MSENFEANFITNNYSIQINILYDSDDTKDTKDTKDTDTDTVNQYNNYYIINNMKDILLEEFSNKIKYNLFKAKYQAPNQNIFIINEPFYLNKDVIDSVRKTTGSNFPAYSQSGVTQRNSLIANYKEYKERSDTTDDNNEILLSIFKTAFLETIPLSKVDKDKDKDKDSYLTIKEAKTLDDLFNDDNFIQSAIIQSTGYHNYIKQIYIKTKSKEEKKLLDIFYNIHDTNLNNKSVYEYFLNPETIVNIYKYINQNSGYEIRNPINSSQKKQEIYNKYFRYVFPNKKDPDNLNDPEKDKILMFHNVFYIIKNIYLSNETIINITNYRIKKNKREQGSGKKKYYISNVRLLDLKDNTTHFIIEENKVTIFIKATLKSIIENPILQINYLIDNLEDVRQNFLPQPYILQPKDISSNYSSYNKIYIHDTLKYIDHILNIDKLYKYSLNKKYTENKEEVFLNTKILKLMKDYLPLNKAITLNEDAKNVNIISNIKFLLYKIFKFYNNKKFRNYYIIDTYIKSLNLVNTYYSITSGKIISDTSEKYQIISEIFNTVNSSTTTQPPKFFAILDSPDARLENNKIYKINVIFRCYVDKNGTKPNLQRRIIAEKCLSRAQVLDEAFSDALYKTFDLPENYLYNKLANITKKKNSTVISKNKKNLPIKEPIEPVIKQTNAIPIKVDIKVDRGGGKLTKKYNYINKTRKHNLCL